MKLLYRWLRAGKYGIRQVFRRLPGGLVFLRRLSRWASGPPNPHIDVSTKKLLVVVHIPKTGGTSFSSVLRRVYGNRFLNVGELSADWVNLRPNPNRILALSGHFPYGWHREMGCHDSNEKRNSEGLFEGREIFYVALVRDPMERLLSAYRYARKLGEHQYHKQAMRLTPSEFFHYLEGPDGWSEWNVQYSMMGGLPENRYFLCAPLERFTEYVTILSKVFDWPTGLEIPHLNDTNPASHEPLEPELLQELQQRCEKDRMLYENVKSRFERGDFPAFRHLESVSKQSGDSTP